jgi:hypothetical protein
MPVTMIANIKWGLADEPPESLPEAFAEARSLWEKKDPRTYAIVERFLECYFLPGEVMGDVTELFAVDPSDELRAERVEVFGVDFSAGPLPSVRATASFVLEPKDPALTQERLDAWQDENDFLDSAISFQWALDDYANPLSTHRGLSFLIDDRQPRDGASGDEPSDDEGGADDDGPEESM